MSAAIVDPQTLPAGDEIEDAVDAAWMPRSLRGGLLEEPHRDAEGHRLSHRYSRDIRAALTFLQDWFAPWLTDFYDFTRLDGRWTCTIEGTARAPRKAGSTGSDYAVEGEAETLPLAICRAMLNIDRGDDE